MSSSSPDSTPSPPHKRAKKGVSEDKEKKRKADREYDKIFDTFKGFYLNRWNAAAASYIDAFARCTNRDKSVVKGAAEFAVASLNSNKKKNSDDDDDLRLIRVLRSNWQMCGRYYITLEASDGNFYEALLVLVDLDDEEQDEDEDEDVEDFINGFINDKKEQMGIDTFKDDQVSHEDKDKKEDGDRDKKEEQIGIDIFKDDQVFHDDDQVITEKVILENDDDGYGDGDDQKDDDDDDDDDDDYYYGDSDDDYGDKDNDDNDDDDVEIVIDEDDDDEDEDEDDGLGGFIECYSFKLEMIRVALYYPMVDKTYGPRCT